jgi:hypothetical protein
VCFSPQADLAGGLVIGTIGVDTVMHCHHPREVVLASLPLLLAGHQLVEALVWWGLQGRISPEIGRGAVWAYLLFAFGVLPVLVPAAVMAIEPARRHRWAMGPLLVIGEGVAVTLLVAMVRGPVGATLGAHQINYDLSVPDGSLLVVAYVAATCGSLLVSSYRHVRIFGGVNLAAAGVIALVATSGFASLWCFWAAFCAGAIALHLRLADTHRGAATPAPV